MKKMSKNTPDELPKTDMILGSILSINCQTPPMTIGDTHKRSSKENCTRIRHDLRRIAEAINVLCKDLDEVEHELSCGNS